MKNREALVLAINTVTLDKCKIAYQELEVMLAKKKKENANI